MGHKVANWTLYMLVAAFVLILVLLPFHAFVSTWGGTTLGPLLVWKSWKELLLVALVPLVVLYLVLRPDVAKTLWGRLINKLILLYAVLHFAWAFVSPAGTEAVLAGLAFNLRFLAVFLLAQLIIASGNPLAHKLKKTIIPWLLATTVVLSVAAIAQIAFLPKDFLAQFGYNKDTTIAPYILVDENQDAVRAFATMRGPNTLGSYLLLPIALALAMVIDQRRNILAGVALGLGAVALALTGSRSAWLGAAVMLVVLAMVCLPPKQLAKWARLAAIPIILLAALFFALATTVPAIRLAVFHSSPGDSSLLEGSSEKHWQAAYEGTQDALQNPLGQGVGMAGPASFYADSPKIAENYFVQIAQEVGVVGLVLFVTILALLFAQFWLKRHELWSQLLLASLAGLIVINIFLHGWADDPTAMTWWAVAGLYAFSSNKSSIKLKS